MSTPSLESSTPPGVNDGTRLAAKPQRIWIFQVLLALQLATATVGTVSAALAPDVQALPTSWIVFVFIRPLVGIPIDAVLILSLQRLGPKPDRVAPALALLWWLISLASRLAPGASPNMGLSTLPPWAGVLILQALLLWFVVSTWVHRATRAYLAGAQTGVGRA